jgi:5-methyltetrahydropteroyltriglutamate--homocysteine methyltransferase
MTPSCAPLADAGCTYVQMDEVLTSCLCDDKQRTKLKNRGDDPERLLDSYIGTVPLQS